MNVNNSGTFDSGTGLITVNKKGTIAIAGGVYNSHGDLTLTGGQLTRDASGVFGLDSGRTLTIQSGGDAVFTGGFIDSTASTILVTGAGSTFSTTTTLGVQGGATFNVAAQGKISAGGLVSIGTATGNGTVTVDGASSVFNANGINAGSNGNTANLTFSNGSSGTIGSIGVAASNTAGTNGTVTIESGSSVSGTGVIVGTLVGLSTGTITITGNNSSLTLTGGTSTIGTSGGSTATVNVQDGGRLLTAPGVMNVNDSGTLNVTSSGILTGPSDFGGTGQVKIAGTYVPGNTTGAPTTSVTFAQNMTFQPTTFIEMELGGVTPDTEHDQLVFNGPGSPHVTWNGALVLLLINSFVPKAGDSFDLFEFDSARSTGSFASVSPPPIPAGLFWRTDQLYDSGMISVSFVPGSYAEWQTAFGTGAFEADDDEDGVANGIEFLLGTNPKMPGAFPLSELMPVDLPPNKSAAVTFSIPAEPADDAHYRVQAGPDLVNWTVIASKDGAGPWTGTANVTIDPPVAGLTKITVAETLPAGTTRRFHRLAANPP